MEKGVPSVIRRSQSEIDCLYSKRQAEVKTVGSSARVVMLCTVWLKTNM